MCISLTKNAVSVNATAYAQAEALDEQLSVSCSELHRAALTEYIRIHRADDITAALGRVYTRDEL